MSTVLFYFLLKIKIHFYSFRMKHRILITNNQKGRKHGQPIPIRPALRIINNYDSRGAITIPILPKVRPLFSFLLCSGSLLSFRQEKIRHKRKQSSACKAVTLFLFSIMLCCYTYLCLGK